MNSFRFIGQQGTASRHFLLFVHGARHFVQSIRSIRSIATGLLAAGSLLFTACGTGNEQGLMTSSLSATGAAVTLAWDPVSDPTVIGYYIHYGKQSPNQVGSCAYEESVFVSTSQGTVTDLDPNATYYFAVSAYNGVHSSCSNEVQVTT